MNTTYYEGLRYWANISWIRHSKPYRFQHKWKLVAEYLYNNSSSSSTAEILSFKLTLAITRRLNKINIFLPITVKNNHTMTTIVHNSSSSDTDIFIPATY